MWDCIQTRNRVTRLASLTGGSCSRHQRLPRFLRPFRLATPGSGADGALAGVSISSATGVLLPQCRFPCSSTVCNQDCDWHGDRPTKNPHENGSPYDSPARSKSVAGNGQLPTS